MEYRVTNGQSPPKLAVKLFRWYCRGDRQEELEGDLEEFFYLRLESGQKLWVARLFFWYNVLRCFRSYSKSSTQKRIIMLSLLQSYLKLAARHSWKNKWAVLINVTGLGLALSMCMFVYMIYAYNFEFDSFYPNTDKIYRLHSIIEQSNFSPRNEISPIALDQHLRNQISGIEAVSSYSFRNGTVQIENEFFENRVGIVSPDFFDMFEIPLKYGSFHGFNEKPVVFLSEKTAEAYFGSEVALGKQLTIHLSKNKRLDVIVAGVVAKIPLNTSFNFDLLINENFQLQAMSIDRNSWSNHKYVTHFVSTSTSNIAQLERYINETLPLQNEGDPSMKIARYELVPFITPLAANHLINRGHTNTRLRPQVKIIFTTLALMVFLTACFNLANTSMALISKRLKEIGIRKTLGSESRQILGQFLFEMAIITSLAFVIALSTANLTTKSILGLFGVSFVLQDFDLARVVLFVFSFLMLTTLVSGLLPAIYAWKFQPVAILRDSVKLKGLNWLNKTLTVVQFSFAIAVLAGGISFTQNSNFLDTINLGYQNEGIFHLNMGSNENYRRLRPYIEQIPGVEVAGTLNHLAHSGRFSSKVELKKDTVSGVVRAYYVGEHYLDLMEVKLISGRNFLTHSLTERDRSILISQTFADTYFEGKDPINQVVEIDGKRRTIVGVTTEIIDDVYRNSKNVSTIFTLARPEDLRHMLIKAPYGHMNELEANLKMLWSKHLDSPFDGELQKDLALGTAGNDTKSLQTIFIAMAILGGLLSIMGIFSLAQLNIAKRVKEISIRKVMGASASDLILIVNKSFALVLAIALVTGSALGYFISEGVLGMIYRKYIDVSVLTSLGCGLIIIGLSISMMVALVIAPARANPVHGLRDE